MRLVHWFMVLLSVLTAGCAATGLEQAREAGGRQLTGAEIRQLVGGKTLHLDAYGFLAEAQLHEDGSLSATNHQGETSGGAWSVRSEDLFCLKFKRWARGERLCSSVYQVGDEYRQFAPNGALLNKFTVVGTASEQPDAARSRSQVSSQRSRETKPAAEAPAPAALPQPALVPASPRASRPLSEDSHAREDLRFIYREMAGECPGCDLREIDLAGADLRQAKLAGADLRQVNFRRTNLRRADLRGANLAGADLSEANLTGADLRGANLAGADLTDANLHRASLQGAVLEGVLGLDPSGDRR